MIICVVQEEGDITFSVSGRLLLSIIPRMIEGGREYQVAKIYWQASSVWMVLLGIIYMYKLRFRD